MKYEKMRNELKAFYLNNNNIERSRAFADKCFQILDKKINDSMSAPTKKTIQHKVIVDEFDPVIFKSCPFYYETGTLTSLSDGAYYSKGSDFVHAGGYTLIKNMHKFELNAPELWRKKEIHLEEKLYLTGPFCDPAQHYNFNMKPIYEKGFKGVYEDAKKQLPFCENDEERDFINAVMSSLLEVKRMSEKFSEKAEKMLENENDEDAVKNLTLIRDSAKHVAWNKPETFYEALNTLAFVRKMIGTLEGVGPNTFGRLDLDLIPFYLNDLKEKRITQEEAYELICKFLIVWDMHYDHDMKMVLYADHELENTYTLGGVDTEGNAVYNDLTKMFLKATREEKIIFPKIKCRYSKTSPKEYLDQINRSVINGTSTVLFQNDDASIPALLNSGKTEEEARNYLVTGCWGITTENEKYDHGSYINLLKPFEFALHHLDDKIKRVGIDFEYYDDAQTFEDFYRITVENSRKLISARLEITRGGVGCWNTVDSLPIFSSTLYNCLEKREDFTKSGGKYHDDYLLIFGLPNIVDSLMAIKRLVYDEKKYTLSYYLEALRNNWQGYEELRSEAIATSGWGDGEEESSALGSRFNNDLYNIAKNQKGTYGGRVHIGHLTYTEIRWWGEETLATPDGRYSGDYFSQGLTPSRLKKIPSVTSVINTMKYLDKKTMASNNVVNIILPADKINLDICEAFLRTVADSAVMSLQLNCTTKEQLLDAQKHPEKYPELIVRVCGFSAKFTSLSPEWQNEVITRNFYE